MSFALNVVEIIILRIDKNGMKLNLLLAGFSAYVTAMDEDHEMQWGSVDSDMIMIDTAQDGDYVSNGAAGESLITAEDGSQSVIAWIGWELTNEEGFVNYSWQ